MTYKFSEGIADTTQTKATLYLYGNLADPNDDLNCFQAVATNENEYMGSVLTIGEATFQASGEVTYNINNEETVSVVLDTATVATDATIWTEVDVATNIIAFCVRYGLYTGDHTLGTSYEVNFLETLVELTVDLRGDFTVTDILVAPKDKLKRTANVDYGLLAFQCTGKDVDGSGIEDLAPLAFNQGDVITVCVEPDATALADGVFMREVERFEYILLEVNNIDQSTTKQLAIEVGNGAAGTRGAMFGLTNIDACLGEISCKIDTILFATFYTRGGTVIGEGTATMQFGTVGGDGDFTQRKLRGSERALQADEAATGDFDVNFEIANNDAFERDSGASSTVTVLAFIGSAVAALII